MSVLYTISGRRLLFIPGDAAVIAASWLIAFVLIYYPAFDPGPYLLSPLSAVLLVVPFLLAFYFFQIYRIMWAYFNVRDVYRLLAANAAGMLMSLAGYTAAGMELPRTLAVPAFLLICGGTLLYRVFIRGRQSGSEIIPAGEKSSGPWWTKGRAVEKRILIAGAGEAGRMILAEYGKKGMDRNVIGFIDDDTGKIGRILGGKMVLGPARDISGVMRDRMINEIIIAMPSVGAPVIEGIVTQIKNVNPAALVRTLPPFTRIFEKSLSPDLRELDISDLLGREEFGIDVPAIESHFAGKTVLVTGAGGSIGSEICKQLLKFNIKRLVALGRGEFSIYTLAKTLGEYMYYLESDTEIIYRIADVKDRAMLESVFSAFRPDIVFHAAAHKHVPLMEFNEIEAVQNNIIGSQNVFDVSLKYGAGECVLVSTDKAVHPVNVMGATKRAAELLACHYFRERGLRTSIVRFGNVIGSRGSVIPLFREQIERGGPVTVTHPDITRYFMSIPEASILVINAAAYTTGGEVFVLDMGKQFRVADIARNLIRLYGYRPDKDIRIEYTGLRPGEKLYEELFYHREKLIRTRNEKIYILQPDAQEYDGGAVEKFIGEKLSGLFALDSAGVRSVIRELVPEFEFELPNNETGKTRLVN